MVWLSGKWKYVHHLVDHHNRRQGHFHHPRLSLNYYKVQTVEIPLERSHKKVSKTYKKPYMDVLTVLLYRMGGIAETSNVVPREECLNADPAKSTVTIASEDAFSWWRSWKFLSMTGWILILEEEKYTFCYFLINIVLALTCILRLEGQLLCLSFWALFL